jgi:tetratricopeptide (TPR) repeat protein
MHMTYIAGHSLENGVRLQERSLFFAMKKTVCWFVLAAFSASLFALPQLRSSRPALIRDTDTAEGKEEPDAVKEKPYDPLMAEKSIKIGDFYLKKKNFTAAIERYLEALQFQPDRWEAFDALGRTYEKNGEPAKATAIYTEFVNKNPDSSKVPEVRSRLAKLEKRTGSKD